MHYWQGQLVTCVWTVVTIMLLHRTFFEISIPGCVVRLDSAGCDQGDAQRDHEMFQRRCIFCLATRFCGAQYSVK